MAENSIQPLGGYDNVLWFFYGLVFYTMGLAILLHSRQYSRLIFAKSLPWLGAFGLLLGVFEWGYVIIPTQIAISGPQITPVLLILHQIVLAIAYLLLFQFGIELMRPFQSFWKWSRLIPGVIFLVWVVGPLVLGFTFISDVYVWADFANGMARYLICLPGSIFSVVGLIRQQRMQIKPMKLPTIDTMIRIAAGALAAFGLFAGVIVPKSFYFPANLINDVSFVSVLLISPNYLRAASGLVLFYSMVRALEVFNIETDMMISNMEVAQMAANERERIARDLHDGALQQVYAAGLMAQSIKKHCPPDQTEKLDPLIGEINQAINQLREFLPRKEIEIDHVDFMGALMPKINEARKYIRIDTIGDNLTFPDLTLEQTRHMASLLSEALSNAIRHSKSERLEVKFSCNNLELSMEIRDFGKGITPEAEMGFGLKNMKERTRLLGADLIINTEKSKGTTVKVTLPLEDI